MCDENICVSGDGAVPNICCAKVLKRPVTMLWCPRAAVYLDIAIMQAFYCDRLVLKIDHITPTDVLSAVQVRVGAIKDEIMVPSDNDFISMTRR
jgi:hypothetical protein